MVSGSQAATIEASMFPAESQGGGARLKNQRARQLCLPRPLLVTVHAQLLAPFMTVNLCLTAFLE
jgi:hypothetical protein